RVKAQDWLAEVRRGGDPGGAKAEARKPEAKKGASADNEREVPGIDYAAVHKAILSGLLSQIGQKAEEGDYLGARQRRFWI
ncbi:hypothetical protein ABTD78_24220, partial [Acinetobacter baumannii]